jgi:hypothetical protein
MVEVFSRSIRPVWIASYPRSGNTFLRIILEKVFRLPTFSLYRVEGQAFADPSAEALELAPFLPRKWRRQLSDDPAATLTLIKTHDLPEDDRPAIYIVRDGRAAIESYFHYHRKFAFEQPSRTEIIAGACQFGSWSEHYQGWQPRTRPGTLLLKYEDMVAQPDEVIPKVAAFLEVQPMEGRLPTFEELREKSPAFFRTGKNQAAQREWSPGQIALFNQLHGEVMRDLGYEPGPVGEIGPDLAAELASSAARIHKLYLRELRHQGVPPALRQEAGEEAVQLAQDAAGASGQIQHRTEPSPRPLRRHWWVKIGMMLGLVPRTPTHPEPR